MMFTGFSMYQWRFPLAVLFLTFLNGYFFSHLSSFTCPTCQYHFNHLFSSVLLTEHVIPESIFAWK
jgi:transposase-like protein